MQDLLLQFKTILETTGLQLLDIACIVYIFKQLCNLVILIYKKMRGVKK